MAQYVINGDLLAERRAVAGLAQNFPAWATGKDYLAGDYVEEAGALYRCLVDHASDALFSNDLAAAKWQSASADVTGALITYTAASPWTPDGSGDFQLVITNAEHGLGDIGSTNSFDASGNNVLNSVNVAGDVVTITEISARAGSIYLTATDLAASIAV